MNNQVETTFNLLFVAAAALALAVILSMGRVSSGVAAEEAYVCSTDTECEQEYFDRFGEWPEGE